MVDLQGIGLRLKFVYEGHGNTNKKKREMFFSQPYAQVSSRVGLFRSRLRTLGTHYHPTLDPVVLWTPSNDTSRPIFSDSLNLMPLQCLCIFGLYGAIQMLLLLLYNSNL